MHNVFYYINLTTTDDEYPVFPTHNFTKLTVAIIADTGTYTWGNAVVTVQFSPRLGVNEDGDDISSWQALPSTVTFITTAMAKRGISISGLGNIRLHVTTADGGADPHAPYTIEMT